MEIFDGTGDEMYVELNNGTLYIHITNGERYPMKKSTNTFTPRTVSQFIKMANESHKYDLISYTKEKKEDSPDVLLITCTVGDYSKTFSTTIDITLDEVERINTHNIIAKKKKSKDEAKKLINRKFNVGDILLLRGKYKDGSARNEKYFEVKKVIWSLKGQIVNALILKQLSGTNNNMSLTKKDCVKYHVKYEPGLQVYPMNLDFKKRKINFEYLQKGSILNYVTINN